MDHMIDASILIALSINRFIKKLLKYCFKFLKIITDGGKLKASLGDANYFEYWKMKGSSIYSVFSLKTVP